MSFASSLLHVVLRRDFLVLPSLARPLVFFCGHETYTRLVWDEGQTQFSFSVRMYVNKIDSPDLKRLVTFLGEGPR